MLTWMWQSKPGFLAVEMLGLKKKKKTERLEQGLSPYRYSIYNLQEAQIIYVQSHCVTTHTSNHWA
jgi:hypothetical protein